MIKLNKIPIDADTIPAILDGKKTFVVTDIADVNEGDYAILIPSDNDGNNPYGDDVLLCSVKYVQRCDGFIVFSFKSMNVELDIEELQKFIDNKNLQEIEKRKFVKH